MSLQYSRSLLKVALAQIAQNLGWNAIQSTPLELLTDILERYISDLGRTTHRYAEQFGRLDATLDDLGLAFRDLGINLSELEDYVKHVDPLPFAHEVVAFPAPKENNLHFPKPNSREVVQRLEDEDFEHIHEHLPPMYPEQDEHEETMSTPGQSGHPTALESPMDTNFNNNESLLTSPGQEPPNKRARLEDIEDLNSSVVLPEEAGHSRYTMKSVEITAQGILSPIRSGKLPDAKPPPAVQRQPLVRQPEKTVDVKPPPVRELKLEDLEEEEEDHINEMSPPSPTLDSAGKSPKITDKARTSAPKSPKSPARTKSPGRAKSPKGVPGGKFEKLLNAAVQAPPKSEHENKPSIMASILASKEKAAAARLPPSPPSREESNSPDPDQLVIATDVKPSKKKEAKQERLSRIDDCIDAAIQRSIKEANDIDKQSVGNPPVEKISSMWSAIDDTIADVVGQSNKVKSSNKEKEIEKPKEKEKPVPPPPPAVDPYEFDDFGPSEKPQPVTPAVVPTPSKEQLSSKQRKKLKKRDKKRKEKEKKKKEAEAQKKVSLEKKLKKKAIKTLHGSDTSHKHSMKTPSSPGSSGVLKSAESKPSPFDFPASSPSYSVHMPAEKDGKSEKKKRDKSHKKNKKKDKEKKKKNKDKDRDKDRSKSKEKSKEEKHKHKEERESKREQEALSQSTPSVPRLIMKIGGSSGGGSSPSVTISTDKPPEHKPEIPKLVIRPLPPKEASPPPKPVKMEPKPAPIPKIPPPSKPKSTPKAQKTPPRQKSPPPSPTSSVIPPMPPPSIKAASFKAPAATAPVERKVISETISTGVIVDSQGQKIWICPACKQPDDGSPMIGCDTCDDWYHWPCVGIVKEPDEEEEWFCRVCLSKKKKQKKKGRPKKKGGGGL